MTKYGIARYIQTSIPYRCCRGDASAGLRCNASRKGNKRSRSCEITDVQVGGRWLSIREANKDTALEWFAEWAAPIVDEAADGQKVLIPIPSSKTTPSSPDTFRTAQIANAVVRKCQTPAVMTPVLRWKKPIPSASEEGGSRDPNVPISN